MARGTTLYGSAVTTTYATLILFRHYFLSVVAKEPMRASKVAINLPANVPITSLVITFWIA
jgi:hypothetical protein